MRKIFTYCFFLIALNSFSQNSNWVWAEQIVGNDWSIGYDIENDISNNTYVSGFFIDSAKFDTQQIYEYQQTGFIAKYDPNGVFQWVNVLSSNLASFAEKIKIDNQGDIIVLGRFMSSLTVGTYNFTSPPGIEQMFLLKIAPNGNVIWAWKTSGTLSTPVRAYSLALDNSDNIYVVGDIYSQINFGVFSANKLGMFIVKFDSTGTPVKLINESQITGRTIDIDNNNNIFFTGQLLDTTIIVNDTLIPTGIYQYDQIPFPPFTDTTYIITPDMIIIKYNNLGDIVWHKEALSNLYFDEFEATTIDDFSNLYVCGYVRDTTNFWGTVLYPTGYSSAFLIKIDSSGCLNWVNSGQPLTMDGSLSFHDITNDNDFVYATATPSIGTSIFSNLIINPGNNYMSYSIIKIDSSGNGIWAIMDSTNQQRTDAVAITIDQNQDINICGFFVDSVHFGNNYLNGYGNHWPNMFLAKLSSQAMEIYEQNDNNSYLKIYPNPTSNELYIELDNPTRTKVIVYNISGKEVYSSFINQSKSIIDVSTYKSGLYLVKIIGKNGVSKSKLVSIH